MGISIRVDAKKAVRDLRTFKNSAIPFAARNSLNRSAFAARELWQEEIRNSFVTRNRYTERSVRVERASGRDPSAMMAKIGSIADYMGLQEHGGTEHGKSGHKAIPGPVAAGLPPGANRTKLVRPANYVGALHVRKGKGRTRAQYNAVAIKMAKRRGERAVLLQRPKGGFGIFKLMGGKRNPKTRLLWDFSRRSVHIKPEPTLQRTLQRVQPRMEAIHLESFVEQLRRHKVFGY